MKAIGYYQNGPVDRADAFVEVEQPDPVPAGRDLLVGVDAVSINPVDVKLRANQPPRDGGFRVLGFDAAGTVERTGSDAVLFKPGDRVFYAGSILRPGSNAQLQLVDERIVGPAPKSLSLGEAAALPLTSITAWEMLFDRLDVRRPVPGGNNAILIVGGAGGVGSIAIQLARRVANLTVIATASRPQTTEWVKSLGAQHVVDHTQPMAPQVAALGIGAPGLVFSTNGTKRHFDDLIDLVAPQGRIGAIDDPDTLDVVKLKRKAASFHWELMFTRSSFETPDMIEQHNLLAEVARLVDAGTLKTTASENFGPITAENLRRAHALVETGRAHGKVVLEGF